MDIDTNLKEFCSVASQKSISSTFLLINVIINVLLSITAVIGNGLIIASYCCTPSLRTPSNVLLCALAVTDFLTGLVVQPIFSAAVISGLLQSHEAGENGSPRFCDNYFIVFLTSSMLCGVSLATLTAKHFDQYLSVILHLRYYVIVTVPRVLTIELLIVIQSSVGVIIILYSGIEYATYGVIASATIAFCLILSSVSFIGIYRVVRRHQILIQDQAQAAARLHGQSSLHMAKVKKSSRTLALVWGVFLLCYGPYTGCVVVINAIKDYSDTSVVAFMMSLTVLFGNSTLNPAMFIFRIKELRDAVLKLFNKVVIKITIVN